MRYVDKKEARGSLKWIRIAVNSHRIMLNKIVVEACGFDASTTIQWLSPIASDEYAEYGDEAFLRLLGINLTKRKLKEFWPNRGPQWDALGISDKGQVILLEAKANIPEIVSPGTVASAESRILIEKSLAETKAFMGIDQSISWSGKLYQYANRLAHLYLLRHLNAIPAHLVFMYFLGDKDVKGPDSVEEWKAAISVAKSVLGIAERNQLGKYIAEIYLHVHELVEPESQSGFI